MNTTFHPSQRVVAKTDAQGLAKGRTYHVIEAVVQPCEVFKVPLHVIAYKVSNWPEKNAQQLTVKAGILHLQVAEYWR